jgi:preprotein translocase subunit SecA
VLGGNLEFLAKQNLSKRDPSLDLSGLGNLEMEIEKLRSVVRQEQEKVKALGGLCVIGTERHESRRIDNQLRGRSGRQGDQGESKFFLALDDKLMRIFGGERIQGLMTRFGAQEGDVISHPLVNRSIATAQKRVEGHNFEIRKHLLEYDDVMNQQREAVYGLRRRILEGESIKDEIMERCAETCEHRVTLYCFDDTYTDEWNFAALNADVKRIFRIDWNISQDKINGRKVDELIDSLIDLAKEMYAEKEARMTPEIMRQMERNIMLYVIDNRWKDHLLGMDDLKDGIYLRGYGQKDPLVEYKHEAFGMFNEMMLRISEEVTEYVFRTEVITERKEDRRKIDFIHTEVSAFNRNEITTNAPEQSERKKVPVRSDKIVGRNDPCPCGSGKKYKKCCGNDTV